MNNSPLEDLIQAVLYEGYVLYPYRPSSKKNRRERFTFGRVYPEPFSVAQHGVESCVMQTECLAELHSDTAALDVSVRFLHPMAREIGSLSQPVSTWAQDMDPHFELVPELRVGNDLYQPWLEAVERAVTIPPIQFTNSGKHFEVPYAYAGCRTLEPIKTEAGTIVAVLLRRQEPINGVIEIALNALRSPLWKLTVRVRNDTPMTAPEMAEPEGVTMRTFASTHTVLRLRDASFISLMDPPVEHTEAAQSCKNLGTWPVLVGDEAAAQRDTMLSSPIILYDYPKLAPESAGSLFDGTEIDELLTLRILTMTDEEKLEMRHVDEQARRLLERTEALPPDALLKMHGAIREPERRSRHAAAENSEPMRSSPSPPQEERAGERRPFDARPLAETQSRSQIDFDDFFGASTRLSGVSVSGVYLRPGDRVRLCPKARADAIDLTFRGQTAIIEAIEQDLEKRIYLAVVLDNDPGKDLGFLRQPGHRFFYGVDEVEPLAANPVP